MDIILIAAVAENNVIGKDGKLPWNLPEDIKHFRQLTLNHPVIMGRKTFQSIGKPLGKRLNIVLTKESFSADGAYTCHSLEHALQYVENKTPFIQDINYDAVYIIGGETVYRQAMPLATILEITHVHRIVEGDAYFPNINQNKWTETNRIPREGYSFVKYIRGDKNG